MREHIVKIQGVWQPGPFRRRENLVKYKVFGRLALSENANTLYIASFLAALPFPKARKQIKYKVVGRLAFSESAKTL